MKTIRNKTIRPLRVPLPRGKVLHLGPQKKGEIADAAVDHPALAKLIEAGEIEVVADGEHTNPAAPATEPGHISTHGSHHPEVSGHQRGDR